MQRRVTGGMCRVALAALMIPSRCAVFPNSVILHAGLTLSWQLTDNAVQFEAVLNQLAWCGMG